MAKDRFDIKEKEGVSFATDAIVIVDKETGVNYLFVHRGYGGGLTPLLDSRTESMKCQCIWLRNTSSGIFLNETGSTGCSA